MGLGIIAQEDILKAHPQQINIDILLVHFLIYRKKS